jgi:hypothetical protein
VVNYVSENGLESNVSVYFNWDVSYITLMNFTVESGSDVIITDYTSHYSWVEIEKTQPNRVSIFGQCAACTGIKNVATIQLGMADDYFDDGDEVVTASTFTYYVLNRTVHYPVTVRNATTFFNLSLPYIANETGEVTIYALDDDVSGVVFTQADMEFTAYDFALPLILCL